ncbi:hypothetical protein B5S32_g629 [[Candida] boidinii]|nr:hypothetical protein B5S32_g629 [[Candida] boidinii]
MTVSVQAYSKHFWSVDDSSVKILRKNFYECIETLEILLATFKERIAIEEDYSRKLLNINKKKNLTAYERGTLGESLSTLKLETVQLGNSHKNQAAKINTEVYLPLQSLISNLKGKAKPVEETINKLTHYMNSLETNVEIAKTKYERDFLKYSGYKRETILADAHEARKLEPKIETAKKSMIKHREKYYNLVVEYNSTLEAWKKEWSNACEVYQQIDEEKHKFLKSYLWEYANAVSTSCVSDDQSSENIRVSLESCKYKEDAEAFIESYATGSTLMGPIEFVDFAAGQKGKEGRDTQDVTADKTITNSNTQKTIGTTAVSAPKLTEEEETHLQFMEKAKSTFKELSLDDNSGTQNNKVNKNENVGTSNNLFDHLDYNSHKKHYRQPDLASEASTDNSLFAKIDNSGFSNTTAASGYSNNVNGADVKAWKQNADELRDSKSSSGMNTSLYSNPLLSNSGYSSAHPDSELYENPKLRTSMLQTSIFNGLDSNPEEKQNVPKSAFRQLLETPTSGKKNNSNKLKPSKTDSELVALFNGVNKGKRSTSVDGKTKNLENDEEEFNNNHNNLVKKNTTNSITKSKSSGNIHDKRSRFDDLPKLSSERYPILQYSRAVATYIAQYPGDLSFKKKDILLVIHKKESGWWYCENHTRGGTGTAPSNYLTDL